MLTAKSPLDFECDANTGEICWRKEVNISNNFAQILGKMVKPTLDDRFKTADEVMKALSYQGYSPTLANCLTTQKLNNKSITQHEITQYENSPETTDVYMPPIARTASAIRKWRERLKETR